MKFIVILIVVVLLSTLFGNIGGFFTAFLNGGQILFNSLSIFITFFVKALEPILTKPYLSMIIYIFLFANVFIYIISVLASPETREAFAEGVEEGEQEIIKLEDKSNKPMNKRKGKVNLYPVSQINKSVVVNERLKIVRSRGRSVRLGKRK